MSKSTPQRPRAPRVQALLEKATVKDLLAFVNAAGRELKEVDDHTSVHDALAIMRKLKITSLPVRSKEDGDYKGFVDTMDVVAHVLKFFMRDQTLEGAERGWSEFLKAEEEDVVAGRAVRFAITPLSKVINASHADPWCPVYESGSLLELAEVFAKGVHRVPVWHSDKKVVQSVLTQTDLVRYVLAPLLELKATEPSSTFLGDLAEASLTDLGLVDRATPVTVSIRAPAIQALFAMHWQRVPAVAVVDPEGALVANLSASDLARLGSEELPFSALLRPLSQLLRVLDPDNSHAPIAVTRLAPLSMVLWKVTLYKVHRVWIVDEQQRPVGLVSLSDLMRLLASLQ